MADAKLEGEELRKLVLMGKKRRLSFAFCPGPKNDHTILIDRRKKPEVIAKVAKKEGAGNKVAFGTFVVKSKTMELTCERVVPAMAKLLKKYLKSQKVLVNILILDEQGAVLERDEEDLPEDPASSPDEKTPDAVDARDESEETTEAPGPDAAGLAGRIKTLQAAIAAAPDAAATKLKKVAALAVSQIKSGDLESADKTIAALEGAVARQDQAGKSAAQSDPSPETGATAPEPRALAARAKALLGVIAGVAGPAGEKLSKALGIAVKQIKGGDLRAADALLARIETATSGGAETSTAPSAAQEAQDAIPRNVVAYTKSRLGWIKARTGLRQELEGLKLAIEQATAGVEGLEEIPAKSDILFSYLDGMDSSLEDTLEQLVETADGTQRETLKSAARKIIDDYRGVLDTDFFKAVDDNGFASTSIRANALGSLQEVSAALET